VRFLELENGRFSREWCSRQEKDGKSTIDANPHRLRYPVGLVLYEKRGDYTSCSHRATPPSCGRRRRRGTVLERGKEKEKTTTRERKICAQREENATIPGGGNPVKTRIGHPP